MSPGRSGGGRTGGAGDGRRGGGGDRRFGGRSQGAPGPRSARSQPSGRQTNPSGRRQANPAGRQSSDTGRHPSGPPGAGEQVEGRQAVRELLRAGRRRVRQIVLADPGHSEPLAEIADLADAAGVAVRVVSREQIEAMALTDAPQGVIARAAPVPERELADLLAGDRRDGPPPFLVVLDGVTDPHNVGAIMRSALSAGATGMVLGRHRSGHLTPAAVKAAAGAVEHLPVATVAGIPAALASLSEAGVWTVGLDAAGATPIWELTVATEPVALVLGAEGRGLSPLVRQRCEVLAAIPMTGPLDSLNVSAAATLACFEISRRRI